MFLVGGNLGDSVLDLLQNGEVVAVGVAAVVDDEIVEVGLGLIVGLAVSVFQATTSIQEQTLAFIPKIIAVFVAILIFGPWMLRIMVEYCRNVFINLPAYLG